MSQLGPPVSRQQQADDCLKALPGRIGQILIDRTRDGLFLLRHRDDNRRDDLVASRDAEAAVTIVRYDDAGVYRSLKTAPNLRHGWALLLSNPAEVRLALDHFYPGRLPAYFAWRRGGLISVPLRETLERQTGMYRVAARISGAQANDLVGNFCRSDGGCLRTILWKRDAAGTPPSTLLPAEKFDPAHDQTGGGKPVIPLLCQEACNLLVAEARKVVKTAGE